MTITIKIPNNIAFSRKERKEEEESEISDDFVMIESSFLKFLHRSWVKVVNKKNEMSTDGGFIVKCLRGSVFLRVPAKKDKFEINFDEDTFFYVKNDDQNYISLGEIKIEKSKISFELKKLAEKEKYLQKKIQEIEDLQKTLIKKS